MARADQSLSEVKRIQSSIDLRDKSSNSISTSRSLPVYAVLMLFTVSRYDTYQTTPSAYKIMPKVRLICRRKWWINFLYINNYYQPEEQCLIHTWYLAADFQLFVIGLAVLTLLWRFPKATFWTAVTLGVVGVVLPMINTYLHAMDAMMPLTMK